VSKEEGVTPTKRSTRKVKVDRTISEIEIVDGQDDGKESSRPSNDEDAPISARTRTRKFSNDS
jgi:hypothetical protein